MNRRKLLYLTGAGGILTGSLLASGTLTAIFGATMNSQDANAANSSIKKISLSEKEWRNKLTAEQFYILRQEGTEKPFTSNLLNEKRKGIYHCAGCDLELFLSEKKM